MLAKPEPVVTLVVVPRVHRPVLQVLQILQLPHAAVREEFVVQGLGAAPLTPVLRLQFEFLVIRLVRVEDVLQALRALRVRLLLAQLLVVVVRIPLPETLLLELVGRRGVGAVALVALRAGVRVALAEAQGGVQVAVALPLRPAVGAGALGLLGEVLVAQGTVAFVRRDAGAGVRVV